MPEKQEDTPQEKKPMDMGKKYSELYYQMLMMEEDYADEIAEMAKEWKAEILKKLDLMTTNEIYLLLQYLNQQNEPSEKPSTDSGLP